MGLALFKPPPLIDHKNINNNFQHKGGVFYSFIAHAQFQILIARQNGEHKPNQLSSRKQWEKTRYTYSIALGFNIT